MVVLSTYPIFQWWSNNLTTCQNSHQSKWSKCLTTKRQKVGHSVCPLNFWNTSPKPRWSLQFSHLVGSNTLPKKRWSLQFGHLFCPNTLPKQRWSQQFGHHIFCPNTLPKNRWSLQFGHLFCPNTLQKERWSLQFGHLFCLNTLQTKGGHAVCQPNFGFYTLSTPMVVMKITTEGFNSKDMWTDYSTN